MDSGSGGREDSPGMDVPITEEPESVDFLLPQIPDDVNVDTFLMDWLASDSQAAAQFQDPQPSEQAAADPLPDPALWENFLPSTAGLSSPAGPALPFQSPAQGFQSAEAQPQALQQSYLEEEPFMEPPSIPSSQPTSGRYSLRPRSATQKEGFRESLGSEDDVSISASEEGEGLPRRGSGKRMGAMLNYANKGVTSSISAVGRGLAGTVQAVKGAAVGGASGFASGLPRKRSKDPEIIKAKELARNRRAQKAFRERQKMLQSERSQSMRSLQESVGQLAEENSELKRKIESFQQPTALRGPSSSRLQAQVDPNFGLEQDLSQEEPLTLSADPDNVLELNPEEAKNLTRENLVYLWKGYVDALSLVLEAAQTDSTGFANQRLQELTKEIARLSQRRMQLSDAQIEDILHERRKAFDNLAAILRQRDSLLQLQVDTLASFTSLTLEDSDIGSAHGRAKQALQRLIDNLRAEQSVVLQSFCVVQQRVFTPVQKAVSIIHAWPYYPLSLELASALAQQRGSPSAADLLNLRINQPGSSGLRTSSASLGPRT